MMKKLLMVVILAGVVLAVAVSRQPNEFRVSRSLTLNAAPSGIFPHLNDLHKWDAWSPWAKVDPSAKMTYSGPPNGVGSSMAWAGNSKVGEGRMTITESHPNNLVRYKLDFIKPFKATNTADCTLTPQGKQTQVTWSMYGTNNLLSKIMGVFMDCDKMIGKEFEKGLASLKTVAESPVKKPR